MDLVMLKEQIDSLDPVLHRALRRALLAEYDRLTGRVAGGEAQPQALADPFEDAFRKAANDLGERYIRGTDDYIREHHPDLYRRTEEADKQMNETWAAGRQGRATIEEFRQTVEAWQGLHLEGIALFAKHQACQAGQKEYQT